MKCVYYPLYPRPRRLFSSCLDSTAMSAGAELPTTRRITRGTGRDHVSRSARVTRRLSAVSEIEGRVRLRVGRPQHNRQAYVGAAHISGVALRRISTQVGRGWCGWLLFFLFSPSDRMRDYNARVNSLCREIRIPRLLSFYHVFPGGLDAFNLFKYMDQR